MVVEITHTHFGEIQKYPVLTGSGQTGLLHINTWPNTRQLQNGNLAVWPEPLRTDLK